VGQVSLAGWVRFRLPRATLDQPFYVRLDDGMLEAGESAEYQVRGGQPGGVGILAASLAGTGSFPVPALQATLDLTAPFLAAPAQIMDVLGAATWSIPIPAGSAGIQVWVQGIQIGSATTNVWFAVIQS